MTTSQANSHVANFMLNHLDSGDFWNDETYRLDVEALAVLGSPRALAYCTELGYTIPKHLRAKAHEQTRTENCTSCGLPRSMRYVGDTELVCGNRQCDYFKLNALDVAERKHA